MKNKNVNINFLLVIVLTMFFIGIGNVNANDDYVSMSVDNGQDIYVKCNEDNNCLTLCVYEYYRDFKYGEDILLQSYFGYYPDFLDDKKDERDEDDKDWEFGTIRRYQATKTTFALYIFGNNNIPPHSDFYWENKKKIWEENPTYFTLQRNFECPLYVFPYLSYYYKNKVCVTNELERNDIENCKGFGDAFTLKYSFAEELSEIVNNTLEEVLEDDNVIKMFFGADDNLEYDDSLSSEDNLKNYCSYFKKIEDTNSYVDTLKVSTEDYFETSINPIFEKYAIQKEAKNKNIYTFKNLVDLLILESDGQNVKSTRHINGEIFYPKLNEIYSSVISKGLKSAESVCGVINVDDDLLKEKLDEYIEQNIYVKPNVDIDTKFDCDSLFSEDLINLIKNNYFAIEIGSVVLTIVLTILDYAKVILVGDQDGIKKANKSLFTRLIIVVVIFLMPSILNFILKLFNIEGFNSENPLCINIKNR